MDQPIRLKNKDFFPYKGKIFPFCSISRSTLGFTLPSIYLRPLPGDINGRCVKLDICLVLNLRVLGANSTILLKV
jgi:hypothetical protein